jgi:hypothetical protein
MAVWNELVIPISTLSAVVAATVWIQRTLSRLERRLEHIEIRISTVEFQNRALLKAFPQVISSLMAGKFMTSEQGSQLIATALETASISEILNKIQPTTNPLTQDDLNRLRGYTERLRLGHWLTPEEAQDFYRLSDIITREYPSSEGSWLLFLIAGILLGTIIAKK